MPSPANYNSGAADGSLTTEEIDLHYERNMDMTITLIYGPIDWTTRTSATSKKRECNILLGLKII
jgi:hypothetical protein